MSYGFHSERKKNPEKFKNQLTNQVFFVCMENNILLYFLLIGYSKIGIASHLFDVRIYDEPSNAFFVCRVHMLNLDLHKDGLLLLFQLQGSL